MTAFNPAHYRRTFPALGNPTDPPATSLVSTPGGESAISLLKGILASVSGSTIIPVGSITFDKLQQINGHKLLGRWHGNTGFVEEITPHAATFGFPNPGILELLTGAITADKLADGAITNTKIPDHSIDLIAKAAPAAPLRLYSTTTSGFATLTGLGAGLTFIAGDPLLAVAPGGINSTMLAPGCVSNVNLTPDCVQNFNIANNTIDLPNKVAASVGNRLWGTGASGLTASITVGAGLSLTGNTLALIGGGGTGSVNTSGAVTAAQLAGYADATGNLIRGVTVGAGLNLTGTTLTAVLAAGGAQPFDDDLTSLAAASATNAIYYRNTPGVWAPVTIGANITFTGGTLAASGGSGTVNTTGGATNANQLAGYADTSGNLIRGINLPAQGMSITGNNLLLTNDLAALEGLGGTNTIYYRSNVDTWTAVAYGPNLSFMTGTLAISSASLLALGALTPAADQLPFFTGPTSAALTTMTAFGRGLLAQTNANGWLAALGGQPLDADLTSIAGQTATNSMFYRSAVDTWAPVTIGGNMTFTGGVLNSVAAGGGGGDVFLASTQTFTGVNTFATTPLFVGSSAASGGDALTVNGATGAGTGALGLAQWAASAVSPRVNFYKSRGGTVGVHGAVVLNDRLMDLLVSASDGTAFKSAGAITLYADGAPSTFAPARFAFTLSNASLANQAVLALDSQFRAIVGNLASATIADTSRLQLIGDVAGGADTSTFLISRFGADTSSGNQIFAKSRGAIGAHAVVAASDVIGNILFKGSDGAGYFDAAQIAVAVSGAPATGQVPGQIRINTRPVGGASLLRRMTIDPAGGGNVMIGQQVTPVHSALLEVHNTASNTEAQTTWAAGTSGATLSLAHSRGAAVGTHAALAINDALGQISFYGSDGAAFVQSIALTTNVMFTPTSGVVRAALDFWTHNGTALGVRARLHPSGGLALAPGFADPGTNAISAAHFAAFQISDTFGNGITLVPISAAGNVSLYAGGDGSFNVRTQATGAGLIVTGNNGAVTIASLLPAGCELLGVTNGSAATAGYVGEHQETTSGSVGLAANLWLSLTGIVIGAGDWDAWAGAQISATPNSTFYVSVSQTLNGPDVTNGRIVNGYVPGGGVMYLAGAYGRFIASATQSLYCTVHSTSGGTASGTVYARRRR